MHKERGAAGPHTEIKVIVNGKVRGAPAGTLLSELALGESPCGGHGRCGKCRVKARGKLSPPTEAEVRLLSPQELAGGIRLACVTRALGDCEIETLSQGQAQILTAGEMPAVALQPTFAHYGVAIDLGTTTLAAKLYDRKGELLADTARPNPQSAYGADVVSRIEAALGGRAQVLSAAVREALDGVIRSLADAAGVDTKEIDGAVITGNTVMLSLLVGESTEPFSRAPFAVKRRFGETLRAGALALSALQEGVPVYLPPCISAFVGADTVCAILATDLCAQESGLLADIGTNGEMALWHGGRLTVCSTAAGPAFEGVGISMGMQATDGAVHRVSLCNGGLLANVIGGGTPKGICGSGLVDAVACMLDLEELDEGGYLEEDPYVIQWPVTLTQQDIRMLQPAKSAICAGLLTLLQNGGADANGVPVLYVAGGFGNELDPQSAARIGLLPRTLAKKARPVGNAALAGACVLLLNGAARQRAADAAAAARVIDLATDPVFSRLFVSGMLLAPAEGI